MKVLNMATSKSVVNEILGMSRIPFVTWQYLTFVKRCDILGSEQEDADLKMNDAEKVLSIHRLAKRLGVLDREFYVYGEERRMVFSPNKAWKGDIPSVYVLIGIPGAGKNTWIERFLEENAPEDIVVLSRDDIRAELGFCNDGDKVVLASDKENEVSEVFNERFVNALNDGKDVILNNINLKKKYRDDFKRLAGNRLIDWIYVYVEAPTIEDNIKRRPTFDPQQLRNMTEVLEWPQPDEYDDIIISKQR
jgi:predicted kinase